MLLETICIIVQSTVYDSALASACSQWVLNFEAFDYMKFSYTETYCTYLLIVTMGIMHFWLVYWLKDSNPQFNGRFNK